MTMVEQMLERDYGPIHRYRFSEAHDVANSSKLDSCFLVFFKNTFDPQLVESTDVEPVDTESRLYMISIVLPAPAGQQLLCHCGKERMEFLIAQDTLSSRGGAQNSQED